MSKKQKTFYQYFKKNMDELGLPVPQGWFQTQAAAVATISAIAVAVEKFGSAVTIGELIGAGVLAGFVTEGVVALGAVSAAFYLGACIGSLAYATGQYSADRLWSSSSSRHYPLALAQKICSVHGIPYNQVLIEERLRPAAAMGKSWKKFQAKTAYA